MNLFFTFITFLFSYTHCLLIQRSIVSSFGNVPSFSAPDFDLIVEPTVKPNSAAYPAWSHHHVVWYNGRHQNQTLNLNLVRDYLSYDIPVGGIICDDGWQTDPNTFVFDPTLFDQPKAMIDELHKLGARVFLWTTSIVNDDAPNWAEGKKKKYFLNDGKLLTWWGGHASWLDYSNPEAVQWWHAQQQTVIDMGIDGWKCDGTDPFVFEFIWAYSTASGDHVDERDYAQMYYRDYLFHLRKFNKDALIMARPVNDYWSFAPHNVMFSGWVGDNDPDWSGLKWALNDILHSAWRNYLNFGSDTGGYRSDGGKHPLGRTKRLLLRWAQLNSLLPYMENGGDNEHRPWIFDQHANCSTVHSSAAEFPCRNETVDVYRRFVNLHMQLNPFLLSSGSQAFAANRSQITPQGEDLLDVYPTSFAYRLGFPRGDIFVHPITEPGNEQSAEVSLDIDFPSLADDGGNWIYWFNNSLQFAGGSRQSNLKFPLSEFPVFKRSGAILPLDLSFSDHTLRLDPKLARNRLSLVVHGLNAHEYTDVYEWRGQGLRASYWFDGSARHLIFNVTASFTVDGSGNALGSKTRGLLVVLRGIQFDETYGSVLYASSKFELTKMNCVLRSPPASSLPHFSYTAGEMLLQFSRQNLSRGISFRINRIK